LYLKEDAINEKATSSFAQAFAKSPFFSKAHRAQGKLLALYVETASSYFVQDEKKADFANASAILTSALQHIQQLRRISCAYSY